MCTTASRRLVAASVCDNLLGIGEAEPVVGSPALRHLAPVVLEEAAIPDEAGREMSRSIKYRNYRSMDNT